MKNLFLFVLRPAASAGVFFGTLVLLSFAYAGWSTPVPTVTTGQTLTKGLWDNLANEIADHDAKIANLSSSGTKVGIGTSAPTDTLTVSGGVTANNFTSPTGWVAIPAASGWTSYASCRRIGSFLQVNGYFDGGTSAGRGWNSLVATLPAACRPSVYVYNVSGACWNEATTTVACFGSLSTDGSITILTSSALRYFAVNGSYFAN